MAKKRENNAGSVWQEGDRWRAAVTLPNGNRPTKRFKDEPSAKLWVNEQLLAIGKGVYVEPSKMTVGEWVLDYLQTYKKPPKIRQRTYERYIHSSKHLTPIADMRIQDPSLSKRIQNLYRDLSIIFAGNTVIKVHNLLASALGQAKKLNLININPMDAVEPPKVEQEEVKIFTKDGIKSVLAAFKEHRHYPLILLAATSGMRLSELFGLRWKDVDLDTGDVYVRQNIQTGLSGIVTEDPKTKHSRRKISIPAETVAVLKEHKANLAANNMLRELCFTAVNGEPLRYNNFESIWKKTIIKTFPLINETYQEEQKIKKQVKELLKKQEELQKDGQEISKKDKEVFPKYKKAVADFEEVYRNFHCLRHTHATMLLAAGEPIMEVSRRLGHAKPSITLDLYGHAIPGRDRETAKNVSKIYELGPKDE